MKKVSITIFTIIIAAIMVSSCRKSIPGIHYPPQARNFRFQLYTTKDLSNDNAIINFSIVIRTSRYTLFDSAFAPMRIKDIPDALNKLVIDKTVRSDSDLAAGFNYEIENVGNSWFLDTSHAGTPFKLIDYDFR